MGLVKLAVYGALGYLAYQMFFAGESSGSMGGLGRTREGSPSRGNRGGSQQRAGAQQMSGGGQGREEETQEPSGTSMRHRVGRGVI